MVAKDKRMFDQSISEKLHYLKILSHVVQNYNDFKVHNTRKCILKQILIYISGGMSSQKHGNF